MAGYYISLCHALLYDAVSSRYNLPALNASATQRRFYVGPVAGPSLLAQLVDILSGAAARTEAYFAAAGFRQVLEYTW